MDVYLDDPSLERRASILAAAQALAGIRVEIGAVTGGNLHEITHRLDTETVGFLLSMPQVPTGPASRRLAYWIAALASATKTWPNLIADVYRLMAPSTVEDDARLLRVLLLRPTELDLAAWGFWLPDEQVLDQLLTAAGWENPAEQAHKACALAANPGAAAA